MNLYDLYRIIFQTTFGGQKGPQKLVFDQKLMRIECSKLNIIGKADPITKDLKFRTIEYSSVES